MYYVKDEKGDYLVSKLGERFYYPKSEAYKKAKLFGGSVEKVKVKDHYNVDEFLNAQPAEQLLYLKNKLDELTHDFQHVEILEIVSISAHKDSVRVELLVKTIYIGSWPEFTNYIHCKHFCELTDREIKFLEV